MSIGSLYQGSRLHSLVGRLRSSELTTGIALSIIIGVIAGLGAVAFRWLIRGIQWIFSHQGAAALDFLGEYYIILLPILGGLLFGPLIYFLAREAKGHGVPEVMEAVAVKGGRIRYRVAAVKALASSICIGSGGSVGREGPIVQIGSSLSVLVAYPDQSIHDALAQFGGRDVGRIPVVDRNNPKKLIGVLRRHDIVRAYNKALEKENQSVLKKD